MKRLLPDRAVYRPPHCRRPRATESWSQSARRLVAGSTFAARIAGTRAATHPAAVNTIATAASVVVPPGVPALPLAVTQQRDDRGTHVGVYPERMSWSNASMVPPEAVSEVRGL